MTNAQDLYAHAVRNLPPAERLRLAALILDELTRAEPGQAQPTRCALDLLERMPGGRLFTTPAEADEYLQGERDSWDR
jgi:hypothetical protein